MPGPCFNAPENEDELIRCVNAAVAAAPGASSVHISAIVRAVLREVHRSGPPVVQPSAAGGPRALREPAAS